MVSWVRTLRGQKVIVVLEILYIVPKLRMKGLKHVMVIAVPCCCDGLARVAEQDITVHNIFKREIDKLRHRCNIT